MNPSSKVVPIQMSNAPFDPFYRYQRHTLDTYTDNANRTFITNLYTVATELGRPSPLLLKFLQYDLSTQANPEKCFLKGAFSKAQIETSLQKCIDMLVICSYCKNPETVLKAKKNEVYLRCKSCGGKTLPSINDKLVNFIIKL